MLKFWQIWAIQIKSALATADFLLPNGVEKIDLALRFGEPLFIEVVKEVAKNMQIEKIYLAPETASKNPKQWEALKEVFPEDKSNGSC